MSLLRLMRGLSLESRPATRNGFKASQRTFMTRTSIRPSTLPRAALQQQIVSETSVSDTSSSLSAQTLDLLPKISSHPSLAGVQVRNGPRATYNPSHFVRKRRHGFLTRLRTRTGRAILKRRRQKQRNTLSH